MLPEASHGGNLGLLVTLPHENRACVLAAMVLLNVLAPGG
jgi:hypothetical protein